MTPHYIQSVIFGPDLQLEPAHILFSLKILSLVLNKDTQWKVSDGKRKDVNTLIYVAHHVSFVFVGVSLSECKLIYAIYYSRQYLTHLNPFCTGYERENFLHVC